MQIFIPHKRNDTTISLRVSAEREGGIHRMEGVMYSSFKCLVLTNKPRSAEGGIPILRECAPLLPNALSNAPPAKLKDKSATDASAADLWHSSTETAAGDDAHCTLASETAEKNGYKTLQ